MLHRAASPLGWQWFCPVRCPAGDPKHMQVIDAFRASMRPRSLFRVHRTPRRGAFCLSEQLCLLAFFM
ncbi:hypothetical protein ABEV41_04470 [Geobacillus thermodenitrificans]|uniref:hypothetical protein n=1 Tax=Geobacillus thermodenitrificans TaxID=33940 RepID=UPI003D191A0F